MNETSAASSDPDIHLSDEPQRTARGAAKEDSSARSEVAASGAAKKDPLTDNEQRTTNNSQLTTPHSALRNPNSLERDLVEFVVFGFSIAVLLCGFIVQPYFVPSGSMAPVLLGLHKDVRCPECGAKFSVGVDEDGLANTDQVRCPHCGKNDVSLEGVPIAGGDQVLVWKGIYQLRPVRRWETVVFVHPQTPRECYVKRAIGLPGELIQIKHGDVYINGEIAAKSFEQLQAMSVPVGAIGNLESPAPTCLYVARSPKGDAFEIAARDFEGEAVAIRDLLSYNAGGDTWERDPIRDVIVDMTIGERCELQFRGLPGTPIRVLVEAGEAWLFVGGKSVRGNEIPKADGRRLTFAYWDGRIAVRWNDKPIFGEWELPAAASDHSSATMVPLLEIAKFDRPPTEIAVRRDVYYTERVGGSRGTGVDEPYTLGPKEYFMMGDNSAVSRDSRAWDHPGVSSELFVGKPMMVHIPLFAWRIPGTDRAIKLPALSRIRLVK